MVDEVTVLAYREPVLRVPHVEHLHRALVLEVFVAPRPQFRAPQPVQKTVQKQY